MKFASFFSARDAAWAAALAAAAAPSPAQTPLHRCLAERRVWEDCPTVLGVAESPPHPLPLPTIAVRAGAWQSAGSGRTA